MTVDNKFTYRTPVDKPPLIHRNVQTYPHQPRASKNDN